MASGLFMKMSALLALAGMGMAQALRTCGSQRYHASQYVCYDQQYLCPIVSGEVYLRCGDGACYSENQYLCVNDHLIQKSPSDNIITQYCGNVTYSPADYYCFDSKTDPFLCPVSNGQTYNRCGGSCYLPTQNGCNNGVVTSIPDVPANSYCHHQYDSCEGYVYLADGSRYFTTFACCNDDNHSTFACVATKCRNLTALGCQINGGLGC